MSSNSRRVRVGAGHARGDLAQLAPPSSGGTSRGASGRMYLGNRLLESRKAFVKRDNLPKAQRDGGAGLLCPERPQEVWIEVIAPDASF
jgi:hypothetical protein